MTPLEENEVGIAAGLESPSMLTNFTTQHGHAG